MLDLDAVVGKGPFLLLLLANFDAGVAKVSWWMLGILMRFWTDLIMLLR